MQRLVFFKRRSFNYSSIQLHCAALIISIALIFVLGLTMVFNTSSAEVLDYDISGDTHQALLKQGLYAFLGLLISLILWFIGYQEILKLSFPILIALTFCLILVFLPGIGSEVNGAHRWIFLGKYSIQPSEFVKFSLPLFYIYSVILGGVKPKSFFKILGCIIVPLFLILIEPANGTTAIIIMTLIMLFILTKVDFKLWLFPIIIILMLGGIAAYNMPHVSARLTSFANPEMDIRGKGHQPFQAKIAAGSGGLTGKGLGQSMQKLHYLPEAQNDYIAAIFAEEFGFIGIFFLIVLYMIMIYAGFYIAIHARTTQGYYMASTIVFLIGIQAFLNLAVVSGLLPSTGLNLPFFSQGGSSLIANFMGLTLLINIAQDTKDFDSSQLSREGIPHSTTTVRGTKPGFRNTNSQRGTFTVFNQPMLPGSDMISKGLTYRLPHGRSKR